jgi:hypothetical protein
MSPIEPPAAFTRPLVDLAAFADGGLLELARVERLRGRLLAAALDRDDPFLRAFVERALVRRAPDPLRDRADALPLERAFDVELAFLLESLVCCAIGFLPSGSQALPSATQSQLRRNGSGLGSRPSARAHSYGA